MRKADDTPDPKRGRQRAARRYVIAGQAVDAPALAGGLHLVATPIGNLRDVTIRALEVLAAADVIACEDTRVTRKLLDHYGIGTPLTPYHEHNAAAARPKILERLKAGEVVALPGDVDLKDGMAVKVVNMDLSNIKGDKNAGLF